MTKHTVLVILAAAFIVVNAVSACGSSEAEAPAGSTGAVLTTATTTPGGSTATTVGPGDTPEGEVFTVDRLAQFDGVDGRPAYIAVDGVIYDVSGSSKWPEGRHSGCNLGAMAGRDLSDELESAPSSMRALVESLPVVGTLE